MSLAYIRDVYRVPARYGARITAELAEGRPDIGTIIGSSGDLLRVIFDDSPGVEVIHPVKYVTYLPAHTTTEEN